MLVAGAQAGAMPLRPSAGSPRMLNAGSQGWRGPPSHLRSSPRCRPALASLGSLAERAAGMKPGSTDRKKQTWYFRAFPGQQSQGLLITLVRSCS